MESLSVPMSHQIVISMASSSWVLQGTWMGQKDSGLITISWTNFISNRNLRIISFYDEVLENYRTAQHLDETHVVG